MPRCDWSSRRTTTTAAVAFYRDALGLEEELAVEGPDGAHVTILDAGRATLEIANPAQKRYIDEVEVGRRSRQGSGLRSRSRMQPRPPNASVAAGAELIASPTETPWRSLNSRLKAPAGLQITLFEEL